jgi:hypothetical protein
MAMVLVKLELPTSSATLARVKAKYGLSAEDVDEKFGLQRVDSAHGVYALRVSEPAAVAITGDRRAIRQSDPKIRPFGAIRRRRASA